MDSTARIRIGQSGAADARQAAREFHVAVAQDRPALVVFFCSSEFDLDALADEMNALFAGVPLVGCTTSGEIGPLGYSERTLVGMSFPAPACSAVVGGLDGLQHFEIAQGDAFVRRLQDRCAAADGGRFALLLVDGLSIREEPVARTFQHALGDTPMIGGSAGDDQKFARTAVFHDGAFHTDSAALALISTRLPFKPFKTQHFVCEDERLVVTEADPARRIVKEINGLPAAEEYARVVGVDPDSLTASHFAALPVVVLIDGTDYVRSIQKALPDGSLVFYSAIEEGLVLRVARGGDLVANLNRTLAALRDEVGPPQLIIACDCILRKLEIAQSGLRELVGGILRDHNVVGFSTYGEQFGGVHVNQTLTGIAIGQPDAAHGDT